MVVVVVMVVVGGGGGVNHHDMHTQLSDTHYMQHKTIWNESR